MEKLEMKSVYFLYHLDEQRSDGFQPRKLVGVYSTMQRAQEALRRYHDKPGFKDHPDDWRILEHEMDRDDWTKGFVTETHEKIC